MQKLSSGYRTPENDFNTTGTACPNPHTWKTHPHQRIRRVSRNRETHALHRGRALLHMHARLADSQTQWLRDVDDHIRNLALRSDASTTRRAIARIIGFNAEWTDLVTRTLTWNTIATQLGVSRRTVARHLKALHEDGFLGRVAAGRSATAKQAAGWTGPEAQENDAPVYALTLPIEEPVDTNVTPPTSRGPKESPARTRARNTPPGAAARPIRDEVPAAGGGNEAPVPASPAPPAWPAHAPAKRKDERLQAALALQARIPPLRKISAKHLASVTRDFMLAGWTIHDLHHALDTRPDGQAHGHFVDGHWVPYTGADGIPATRFGHFLRFRLTHWRTHNGQPLEAPSHRETRRARTRAQQHAAQQRHREEQAAQRHTRLTDPAYHKAKTDAMTLIHSLRPRRY